MKLHHADFASEAMVRVLAQGLRGLGLSPPALPAPRGATVPLNFKRALVEHAVGQGGLRCLPLLGRGLHAIGAEPTYLALTAAQDGHAMLLRWQRLERYIHSRHRTVIQDTGPGRAVVAHVSQPGQPEPLSVEDLVVSGVLCALLEANGCQAVQAHAGDCALYPSPQEAEVSKLVQSGRSSVWHLTWQPATRATSQGLSLAAVDVVPGHWSAWAQDVGTQVAGHLPEVPRLKVIARQMGMAARSFQRALTEQGLSFRVLVSEVRFRRAGWCLLSSAMPLAEAGFVSGYADQSHLSREFQRRMGLTPARYRALFAVI